MSPVTAYMEKGAAQSSGVIEYISIRSRSSSSGGSSSLIEPSTWFYMVCISASKSLMQLNSCLHT